MNEEDVSDELKTQLKINIVASNRDSIRVLDSFLKELEGESENETVPVVLKLVSSTSSRTLLEFRVEALSCRTAGSRRLPVQVALLTEPVDDRKERA